MGALFKNRSEAGQKLAQELEKYRDENPVILALPRGGLPVGFEVARHLKAPLDILMVRKIGAPMSEELAAGAVVDGTDPQLVLNEDVVRLYNVPDSYIQDRARQQLAEIERRRKLYRPGHPPVDVAGKTVIIVDDGIATGSTVRAALKGLKNRKPARLVVAVPVAPAETITALQKEADDVICLEIPSMFMSIGGFYRNFDQLSDQNVVDYLEQAS